MRERDVAQHHPTNRRKKSNQIRGVWCACLRLIQFQSTVCFACQLPTKITLTHSETEAFLIYHWLAVVFFSVFILVARILLPSGLYIHKQDNTKVIDSFCFQLLFLLFGMNLCVPSVMSPSWAVLSSQYYIELPLVCLLLYVILCRPIVFECETDHREWSNAIRNAAFRFVFCLLHGWMGMGLLYRSYPSTQLIFGFISYAFVAFQKIVIVTLTSIRQFDRWHFGGMRERSMIRTR